MFNIKSGIYGDTDTRLIALTKAQKAEEQANNRLLRKASSKPNIKPIGGSAFKALKNTVQDQYLGADAWVHIPKYS